MKPCPLDEPTLQRFATEIAAAPPRPHHAALLKVAGRLLPQCVFSHALSRGGWHRPGGVVRPDGRRISADIEGWVEATLADCGGDLQDLLERHADDGLLATRLVGRTHYFVAPYAEAADAFLQLEVEELQEVADRLLIDPRRPPADALELVDPPEYTPVQAHPIGRPYYRFRRLTDMRLLLAGETPKTMDEAGLGRFLSEWSASSAARRGPLCAHWVMDLREHIDRYRNRTLRVSPLSRHARALKAFHWHPEARGVALAEQLHAFDRAAGYPAAWYFHLVASGLTPSALAQAIAEDLMADYRYLPECDVRLLQGWLAAPYHL